MAPRFAGLASPITVNGTAGALFGGPDDPIAVISFTVAHGRIAAIDLISDPDKLGALTARHQAPGPAPLTTGSGRVEQQPGTGPDQPRLEAVRAPARSRSSRP